MPSNPAHTSGKSAKNWIAIILSLLGILILNPIVWNFSQTWGLWDKLAETHPNWLYPVPAILKLLCIGFLGQIFWSFLKIRKNNLVESQSWLYPFFLFLMTLGLLAITNPVEAGRFPLLRLLLLLIVAWFWLKSFYLGIIKSNRKNWVRNLGTVIFGLGMLFLMLEGTFFFVSRSHQNMMTHASKRWYHQNWQLNAQGFRDKEPHPEAGKKQVLLLGDSFTAGWGIKNPDDRFSNQLQERLGNGWQVYNLGENGAEPQSELAHLRKFPVKPDHVVLVWYVNDLHQAAEDAGISFRAFTAQTETEMRAMSWEKRSCFLNYVYWLFPHRTLILDYYDFLRAGFSNPEVMQNHFRDLEALRNQSEKMGGKFSVMLFPLLRDVEGSDFALDPVIEHLQSQGIATLDLRPLLSGHEPEELVVNTNDTHPNERVHTWVADTLQQFILKID